MTSVKMHLISLMDARRLKNAMGIVAKLLVAASQLVVQEVRFRIHGAAVEGWKYIARGIKLDDTRLYTLEESIACIGYHV